MIEAQSRVDAKEIESGKKTYREGKLQDVLSVEDLKIITQIEDSESKGFNYLESKRIQNLAKIVSIAGEEIPEQVDDNEVDEDWMTRFLSYSQDISNINMQEIWGKILRGEVSKPNQYSLRTLEVVKNLTTQEAHEFESIMPYVWESYLTYDQSLYLYLGLV